MLSVVRKKEAFSENKETFCKKKKKKLLHETPFWNMALQVTAQGVSTSSHFQEKVLLFSQHLDNAFVLYNASFVPIWHCFEWQSKRCNYLHLFFILHIPPPLFL